jgi:hypothetical protein
MFRATIAQASSWEVNTHHRPKSSLQTLIDWMLSMNVHVIFYLKEKVLIPPFYTLAPLRFSTMDRAERDFQSPFPNINIALEELVFLCASICYVSIFYKRSCEALSFCDEFFAFEHLSLLIVSF